ncbi:MAG TPA: hypothetical protein VFO52_00960 [Longimicrobiales bacterium]|nr:hypothetical protein [Longimicrobiales bacterium]
MVKCRSAWRSAVTRSAALCFLALGLAAPLAAQEPQLQWPAQLAPEPVAMLGPKPIHSLVALDFSRPVLELDRPSFESWLGNWGAKVELRLPSMQDTVPATAPTAQLATEFLPPPPIKLKKAAGDTTAGPDGILSQYGDLGMRVVGRGEMGGSWNRYSPCDPGLQLTCNPGLFPQLRPDVRFGVLVGGTISDRVHVSVDYDQSREFDATNNINVYYQGLPDEILQRLEVGDVSIQLPASRYMTQGIPAGNFGFKATGQLGPLDFQTVFAQQRGDVTSREFRLAGGSNTAGLVQNESVVMDDADYVKGQFFYLVDPLSLSTAPHVDAIALRAGDVAPDVQPAHGGIEVYRDERPAALNQAQQASLGYFLADAYSADRTRKHSGQFRRLEQDVDYVVHASGLWIMLRAPLRTDEALAISYVSEIGDTIGTINAEGAPLGVTPELRLIRGPVAMHQPGSPTWNFEMHNVYRVHTSNSVDLSTVQLTISLGEQSAGRTFVNTAQGPISYLRLFGLDEDAPAEALDVAQVFQPTRNNGPGTGSGTGTTTTAGIVGTYVIFPTLRPFYQPPPTTQLPAPDAQTALGADANEPIYENPDPITRDGSGRFRVNLSYRVHIEGLVSAFNLGAIGIRDNSEKIFVGNRQLTRGVDYEIDYEIGMVTLSDAQGLFATDPDQDIRATFEQNALFQIAPTSVFGMNTRYNLGKRGELNFVGLYQAEKSIMSRPQLGVEPGSIFLGGTSGHLQLGGALLNRALAAVPGLRLGGTSAVNLRGEMAFSLPNPNTRNEAYVDDFEAADELGLSMRRREWQLGSRPGLLTGAETFLPGALDATNAAGIVWQHDILQNGQPIGPVKPSQIDQKIRIAGAEVPEPVMWLTLGEDARPIAGRRWRSLTTVISTTGSDLTRTEFLEFYANTNTANGKALILDIGTVSEDAFYFDAANLTNGQYPDGQSWGLGVLDAETNVANREPWSTEKDNRGLWNRQCTGVIQTAPPLGDPSANCARANGLLDTEDLDGNGILDDADGAYHRYVIPLTDLSPYLVRGRAETGTNYQLYRVPLRDGIPVNFASASTWRFVKHLRMTVTSESSTAVDNIVLARMRIIGSRWMKRDGDGVVQGLTNDDKGTPGAEIRVSPVSRLTNGEEYASPPAVGDELQDPTQGFGATGAEFNEKGLGIRYTGVAADNRAEVYFRYPQQPRNFMNYRQLSMWAVAKTGNWGPSGDQRLIVRIGTDARNYYMFQTRLKPAVGDGNVTPADWAPQVVIDFEQWFRLKAQAEVAMMRTPPAGNEPFVLFSEDSTYAIVLEDRARAPNLAAVRELSFAVYNGALGPADGEVWLNDMRLGAAFKEPGMASNLSLEVLGGDFLSANLSYANQGALFRQLNQDAGYQAAGDFSLNTTAQLGNLLPVAWGMDIPLTVAHARNRLDPMLLQQSDVRAEELEGLRETGASTTRIGLSLRKTTPSSNPLVSALIDGISLRLGYNTGDATSISTRSEARGLDGALSYTRDIKAHDFDIMPGFIESVLRVLAPSAIEKSGFFQRLVGARLRYTPQRVQLSTAYFGQERSTFQYQQIIRLDSDSLIVPIEAPRKSLDADASVTFMPFTTLSANFALRTSRDLLPAQRASQRAAERSALQSARSDLIGVDLGWEAARTLSTSLNWMPRIADWVRPNVALTTRFSTDRNPSYIELLSSGSDSTAILQRRFQADRQLTRGVELMPQIFFRTLVSDTTGFAGTIGRALAAIQPVSLRLNTALGSQFERETINPGMGYQFALGDLESFRLIGIDSAISAIENARFEARSGLRFTKTAQLDVIYSNVEFESFDQRGGSRLQRDVIWPNVQLNWSEVPLPQFMRGILPRVGGRASFERVRKEQSFTSLARSDRGEEGYRVPFSLNIILPANILATYNGTWSSGDKDDPTGDVETNGFTHQVNLSGTFKPPAGLARKMDQPIRTTLSLSQNTSMQCRFRQLASTTGESACVPYIDFRNRTVNFTLDTFLSDMTVGLQMSYTGRQDYVGIRRSSSQFQLGLFGEFNLSVGQIPGAAIAPTGIR